METNANIQISMFVPQTEAEGPGNRFALWVQGCDLGCPDCCNPEMWNPNAGQSISVEELFNKIEAVKDQIEGVSFLGGEPFQQDGPLAELARRISLTPLNLMIYSGYTMVEIIEMNSPLLPYVDLLVTGRYLKEEHTTKRRWIGSENQEMHFLTNAYSPEDPCFSEPNHAELRLNDKGEMTIVGFPFQSIRENFRPKKIEV